MKRLGAAFSVCAFLLILGGGWGSAAEPAGPKNHIVRIESMKFVPSVIFVQPGDTVEFVNTDLVPHTVTERSARAFDSGVINAKTAWRLMIGKAGALEYRCIYHPDMTGRIVVRGRGVATTRSGPVKIEICGGP